MHKELDDVSVHLAAARKEIDRLEKALERVTDSSVLIRTNDKFNFDPNNHEGKDKLWLSTEFFVLNEGDHAHELWKELAKSDYRKYNEPYDCIEWEQLHGESFTIGWIGEYPIQLEGMFYRLNGHLVCFYRCCSLLAHWGMVDDFMNKHFNNMRDSDGEGIHTNATNFFSLIHYFEKKDGKEWFPRRKY